MTCQKRSYDLCSTDDQHYHHAIQTSSGCFSVKVSTYLLPPQNERQLAAAAGGDQSELSVPEGFKRIFQETMRAFVQSPRGLLMNHSHCMLQRSLEWFHIRNVNNRQRGSGCLSSLICIPLKLCSDFAV